MMTDRKCCTVEGCDRDVLRRGLCSAHYSRWQRHGDPLGGLWRGAPMRFAEGAKLHTSDECLIWPFARSRDGYGSLRHEGKVSGAHRVICQLVNGPAPTPKHEAAHNCGNGHKGCVAPKHLRWATHAENHADKRRHGTSNIGEKAPSSKLTASKVKEIRELREQGMLRDEIARRYHVCTRTIDHLLKGDTWVHV